MAGKSGQPPQEPTPPTDAHASHQHPGRGIEGTQVYDVLLRQYGEAMLRIGQLEAQVGSLTARLKEAGGDAEWTEDSAPKSQSLEVAESTATDSKEDISSERQRDAEIAQLRLQEGSLRFQLAQSEQQVKGERGRRKRRTKSDHWPKWMFWRRSGHR